MEFIMGSKKKDGFGLGGEEDEAVPGILPSTDPFFGFVTASGGINNYMNPAMTMQAIRGIRQRDLKYSFRDILSREPSFDPLGDDEYECKDHQVTDLSEDAHTRLRKVITDVELVDDVGLIMGDMWYPGASGYRFIYEVSTSAPGRYLALGTVPCAQLLFIYTAPKKADDELFAEKLVETSAEVPQGDAQDDEGGEGGEGTTLIQDFSPQGKGHGALPIPATA